jgi:hypothetical protein
MTTQDDIREWLKRGVKEKQTHVIVVCDTYDHEDYPVFVGKDKDVREIAAKYQGQNMQRIMEVYNLSLPLEDQLKEVRAFHY